MNNSIILGTVQFGLDYGINNENGKPSVESVFEILDYAFTNGIKVLDTADAYGEAQNIIGKYMKKKPNSFLINTKFNTHRGDILEQLGTCIKQLNIDCINVYFYHNFDVFINNPSLRSQLLELKKEGKIKKIGLSVYDEYEFLTACNTEWIDVIQFPFNLLDNYSKRQNQIELSKRYGKELQVRSVFLQGLFFKPIDKLPEKLIALKPYLTAIKRIYLDNKITPEELALRYVMSFKNIDNIIIGVDSLNQLKSNIELLSESLTTDVVSLVDNIHVKENELLYPKNW